MLELGHFFDHILRYNKSEGLKQTLKVIKLVSHVGSITLYSSS